MSSHSIYLCSSQCKDTYPENHGGEFSNVLNQSLEFDDPNDEWTVALGEMYYLPDLWYNVREGFNEIQVSIQNLPVTKVDVETKKYYIYCKYMTIENIAIPDKTDNRFTWNGDKIVDDGWREYDPKDPNLICFILRFYTKEEWEKPWGVGKSCYSYKYFSVDKANYGGLKHVHDYRQPWRWPDMSQLEGGYSNPKAPTQLSIHYSNFIKDCLKKTSDDDMRIEVLVYGNRVYDEELVVTTTVPPNQYPTVESLLASIQRELNFAIKHLFDKYHAESSMYDDTKENGRWVWLDLKIDTKSINPLKIVQITQSDALHSKIRLKIKYSRELQFQLGYTDYPMLDLGWITFGRNMNATIHAMHPPDIYRNTLRSIWVFCDIVQPSHVGKNKLPLLRFLPVDNSTHQISYEVASHLQFKPIGRNSIETIKVWLAEDERGIPLILSADSYIQLIFNRVE